MIFIGGSVVTVDSVVASAEHGVKLQQVVLSRTDVYPDAKV